MPRGGRGSFSVDFSAIKEYANKVNALSKNINELGEQCTRAVMRHFLSDLIMTTPVKTGRLRRSWFTDQDLNANFVGPMPLEDTKLSKPTQADVVRRANEIPVRGASGKMYSMTVKNNMVYASWVNYGHAVKRGGKTVGYADGKRYLQRSIASTQKSVDKIIKQETEKYLRKALK